MLSVCGLQSVAKKGFKCPMCGAGATRRLLQRDDSLQKIVNACIEAADAFEDDIACEIELAQPLDYVHPALAAAADTKMKAESSGFQQQQRQRPQQRQRYDVDSDDDENDDENDEQPDMDIAHDATDAVHHATQSTELATEHAEAPQVVHIFSVGDIVHVQARTWPGVNKPGGVGRVTAVNEGNIWSASCLLLLALLV